MGLICIFRAGICVRTWMVAVLLLASAASAQFKVVGPAPYPEPVARQKIRTLLQSVDANNRQQTTASLTELLNWYRDLIDEELITAWRTEPDKRSDLAQLIDPLATPRVASGIVEFSWRERDSALRLDYAPMLEHLMTRYAESGRPMLAGLQSGPDLSGPAAEAVCRILIDMPDIGAWRKTALRVLPRYREIAERLLAQDLRSGDSDRQDRAGFWLDDPRSTLYTGSSTAAPGARPASRPRPQPQQRANRNDGPVNAPLPGPGPEMDSLPPPATSSRPTLMTRAAPATAPAYNGPMSGTLECTGAPVPQNAEFVFRNLPAAKLRLEYDTKIWDARLVAVDGSTQKLILKNLSAKSQKHCKVHWTVTP